jgi:hypothetical protein
MSYGYWNGKRLGAGAPGSRLLTVVQTSDDRFDHSLGIIGASNRNGDNTCLFSRVVVPSHKQGISFNIFPLWHRNHERAELMPNGAVRFHIPRDSARQRQVIAYQQLYRPAEESERSINLILAKTVWGNLFLVQRVRHKEVVWRQVVCGCP